MAEASKGHKFCKKEKKWGAEKTQLPPHSYEVSEIREKITMSTGDGSWGRSFLMELPGFF